MVASGPNTSADSAPDSAGCWMTRTHAHVDRSHTRSDRPAVLRAQWITLASSLTQTYINFHNYFYLFCVAEYRC